MDDISGNVNEYRLTKEKEIMILSSGNRTNNEMMPHDIRELSKWQKGRPQKVRNNT